MEKEKLGVVENPNAVESKQLSLFKEEPKALAPKPLEILALAKDAWVDAARSLSMALQQDCNEREIALLHEWVAKTNDDLDSFKTIARQRLETFIKANGRVVTDKGTLQLDLGGGLVQRATVTGTGPDSKLTEQMFSRKQLPHAKWMDQDVKYKANEVKLKLALELEQITEEDYKSCFKPVSYRIGKTQVVTGDNDE